MAVLSKLRFTGLVLLCACATDIDLFGAPLPSCVADQPIGEWQAITPDAISLDINFNGYNEGVVAIVTAGPTTAYVTATYQGIWRTDDCGVTWRKMNTGTNATELDTSQPWTLVIDPRDSDVLYTSPAYYGGGIWQSRNGGVDWTAILPVDAVASVNRFNFTDISSIALDPHDSNHLIASFASPWLDIEQSGVIEGHYQPDSDTWTWELHAPVLGMGSNNVIAFANDSDTWILMTRWNDDTVGTWRTADGGQSFTQVSFEEFSLHGAQLYRDPSGVLYHTSIHSLIRSADNGETWENVSEVGTQAVQGDGERIFVSTNTASTDPMVRTWSAPENPGDTGWAPYGSQLMTTNARMFALGASRDVLYSVHQRGGIYRMRLR